MYHEFYSPCKKALLYDFGCGKSYITSQAFIQGGIVYIRKQNRFSNEFFKKYCEVYVMK